MATENIMKTSKKGREYIAAEEGLVLKPYKDVVGIWTQGVGHTSRAGEPKVTGSNAPWSREYALWVLENDLAKTFEPRVRKAMPGAKQHEFDGGVSYDFNTGAIHSASWVGFWKSGDPVTAGERFRQWVKAGGRTIAGLVSRRNREWRLITLGDYGDGIELKVEPAVVKRGNKGPAVVELQENLARLGYFIGKADGDFGPATEAAVKAFQKDHPDLTVDGRAGPATRAQVQRALDLRAKASGVALAGSTGAAVPLLASQTATGLEALTATGLSPAGASLVVAGVAASALITLAVRYRGELAQAANKLKS